MMHEKVSALVFYIHFDFYKPIFTVYDTLFKSTADIFKQFLESEAASMSSIYQHVLECGFGVWGLSLRA